MLFRRKPDLSVDDEIVELLSGAKTNFAAIERIADSQKRRRNELHDSALDAVLAGDSLNHGKVNEPALDDELELRIAAANAVPARHRELLLAKYTILADEFDHEAERIRAEVSEHEQTLNSLLLAVVEFDGGANYGLTPKIAVEYQREVVVPSPRSKLSELRERLEAAQGIARSARIHPVMDSGAEEASSPEELITKIWSDTERVWPSAFHVREWAISARAAASGRVRSIMSDPHDPYNYRLVWKGGVIDRSVSGCNQILAEAAGLLPAA